MCNISQKEMRRIKFVARARHIVAKVKQFVAVVVAAAGARCVDALFYCAFNSAAVVGQTITN